LHHNPLPEDRAMERFVARYGSLVTSILSGFDRLVFRGTLLPLMRELGMYTFLKRSGVRLLDYKPFVLATSELVKEAALRPAHKIERPIRYLPSSTINKEALARRLLDRYLVDEGLICVLTAVEPCTSFEYHRSRDREERGLKPRLTKCLHVYQYRLHPTFGFLNARIQTWFPFNVQICLNGREWLARAMDRAGLHYRRQDNCFTWLEDPERAQRLMDKQLTVDWRRALTSIARTLNPVHQEIFRAWPMDYYWSAYQSEWATDVCFKDPAVLARIYPALVRHAMHHFQSPDVMRFLSQKAPGNFTGELLTSFKDRYEGVRVKHWVEGNSIKMYDKFGNLRVETTIAEPGGFKVYRPLSDDPNGKLAWRPLRKGIADLHRRAQVSQGANERYLDALSTVDDETPLAELFDQVAKPTTWHGKRARALRIGDPQDVALLQAISRGEFSTNGFRNRDLRRLLEVASFRASKTDQRRASARIGRKLRLLRAHGIIQKVPKTQRYRLSQRGQLLTAALFAARSASLKKLVGNAA
jgi:hypothetical protein